MREWFSLNPESGLPWLPLAREALDFAQAGGGRREEPMSVLRVRGPALPGGELVDLYADGDRWTTEPVAGAELVAEGWLLPGLADAHTHPGAAEPGDPLDERLLREDLYRHVASGVTMIRSPGLAGDPPGWFGRDGDVPRAVHAGPWIAQHGQFFDGWGRRAASASCPRWPPRRRRPPAGPS